MVVNVRRGAVELLWVLVIIGYPAVALLGTQLNVPSSTVSLPFRGIVALLSAGLLLQGILAGRRLGAHPVLMAFFLVYSARLLWDWLVRGIPGADMATFVFAVTVLLPTLALIQGGLPERESRLDLAIMLVGAVVCAGVVAANLYGGLEEKSVTDETGRLSYEALNPISLGHAAASTVIAAFALLYRSRTAIVATGPVIAMAIACLVFAASRGPVAALLAALSLLAFKSRRGAMLLCTGIAIVLAAAYYGDFLDSETAFAARFSETGEDLSSVQRFWYQASALAQFVESPLIGTAFVERGSLTYPHNVFVEVLMATGLIGALPFLGTLWGAFREALRRLREGHLLLAMLFVQYFIGFQFSGAIWSSAAFWATCGALVSARRKKAARARAVDEPGAQPA